VIDVTTAKDVIKVFAQFKEEHGDYPAYNLAKVLLDMVVEEDLMAGM